MTKVTTNLITSLEKNMNSKSEKLQKTVDDFKEYEIRQDKVNREYFDRIQGKSESKLVELI